MITDAIEFEICILLIYEDVGSIYLVITSLLRVSINDQSTAYISWCLGPNGLER